jgi:hypothetical protein
MATATFASKVGSVLKDAPPNSININKLLDTVLALTTNGSLAQVDNLFTIILTALCAPPSRASIALSKVTTLRSRLDLVSPPPAPPVEAPAPVLQAPNDPLPRALTPTPSIQASRLLDLLNSTQADLQLASPSTQGSPAPQLVATSPISSPHLEAPLPPCLATQSSP